MKINSFQAQSAVAVCENAREMMVQLDDKANKGAGFDNTSRHEHLITPNTK